MALQCLMLAISGDGRTTAAIMAADVENFHFMLGLDKTPL